MALPESSGEAGDDKNGDPDQKTAEDDTPESKSLAIDAIYKEIKFEAYALEERMRKCYSGQDIRTLSDHHEPTYSPLTPFHTSHAPFMPQSPYAGGGAGGAGAVHPPHPPHPHQLVHRASAGSFPLHHHHHHPYGINSPKHNSPQRQQSPQASAIQSPNAVVAAPPKVNSPLSTAVSVATTSASAVAVAQPPYQFQFQPGPAAPLKPFLHRQPTPTLTRAHSTSSVDESQLLFINQNRAFDPTLVEEFDGCVKAIMMALARTKSRNVYRQVTGEVAELYSRVCKGQIPKKAVKRLTGARGTMTDTDPPELEFSFQWLSEGLENRRSSQLYETIINYLYKLRLAIPDS